MNIVGQAADTMRESNWISFQSAGYKCRIIKLILKLESEPGFQSEGSDCNQILRLRLQNPAHLPSLVLVVLDQQSSSMRYS